MASRRFPAPWSVVDIPGGYRVEDANRQPLGYFYSWDDPSAEHQAGVLTQDEARRMAENFAQLPDLLTRSDPASSRCRDHFDRRRLGNRRCLSYDPEAPAPGGAMVGAKPYVPWSLYQRE
jgi:hypothetical protein